MLDLSVFVPRLKQVAVWTEHLMQQFVYPYDRQNHGAIFRQINPVINGQPLYSNDNGYYTWNVNVYDLDSFRQAMLAAYLQRDAEMEKSNIDFSDFQSLGRILYLHTQRTTHDGVAIAESNGLIDESDVLPIDTWFYFDNEQPVLFCWIPKRFESIMQHVADVDIMDSYHWFDEEYPHIQKEIVAAMAI